jgi:hypothetical protein
MTVAQTGLQSWFASAVPEWIYLNDFRLIIRTNSSTKIGISQDHDLTRTPATGLCGGS